jgi:hypothetical protein
MKINNFALIIGAMKCGTTSLFKYLAQHPQISASRRKEIGFFCHSKYFSKGLDYYQNMWDWNYNFHKIALDASPGYTNCTSYLNAAENIAKVQKTTNTNFKFIYIMRNPIDRIESHYNNALAHRHEELYEPDFNVINNTSMINMSKYAMQIDEYYKRFDADNILLLNFEDLKVEPLNLLKKVCQFLDVNPNHEFQGLDIYNSHEQKTRIDLPGYSLIRKTELMSAMVKRIPDQTRKILRKPFARKVEPYVKLSPEQRSFLLNELQDDLEKLSKDYGIDINRWNININ